MLAHSFGTCELSPQSKNAFSTQQGCLQQVQPNLLDHPENLTATTDIVMIPKAHPVQGAADEAGNQVHAVQTDQSLTTSLERFEGLINMKLPAQIIGEAVIRFDNKKSQLLASPLVCLDHICSLFTKLKLSQKGHHWTSQLTLLVSD